MRAALWMVVVASASCGPWWGTPTRLGGDQILAPHATHLRAKVDCLVCHEEVYDAKDLSARYVPPEKTCLQCHRERKEKHECSFCHTDWKRAVAWPPAQPTVRISHADHLPRVKDDCTACHKVLPNPIRGKDTAPPMSACLSCHEHKQEYDEGRCRGCHLDLQRFQVAPLSTFSHSGNFVREHGRSARSSADSCAECHDQTFCADCHAKTAPMKIELKLPERVDERFIHRDDYVGRHAVEARADEASCRRCHGSSFCENCHQQQNLTPFGANPRDPHPPGWSFPGSSRFHGTEARRDIASCAPCHDQGARSICVDCHKVGGVGGNPHPPGWTDRHDRAEAARNGMCLACHLGM